MAEPSLLLTEDSSRLLRVYTFRFFAANDMCNPYTLKYISTLRSPKGRIIRSFFYVTYVDGRFRPQFQCVCGRPTSVATGHTIREPAVNDK
jgi:hypothetical protein